MEVKEREEESALGWKKRSCGRSGYVPDPAVMCLRGTYVLQSLPTRIQCSRDKRAGLVMFVNGHKRGVPRAGA